MWHQFIDDLRKLCSEDAGGGGAGQGTLDDVLTRHDQFLDLCLKECMLTNGRLMKVRTRRGGGGAFARSAPPQPHALGS